jgi:hypothetical protein
MAEEAATLEPVVSMLRERLVRLFGSRIERMVLFGSM